jgi:pilus assembly protein FimV
MAKVRQLLIGLASGSALYSGLAPALGLGEISLHSALSQPLDAEIELFSLGDLGEADIKVRLASPEVFSRSGVDRLYFLNDLRFTPLFRNGRSVIRVVSSRPVHEPYLNFIIEVARPSGALYREYTLLLDPPGSSAYRSATAPLATMATPQPSRFAESAVAAPAAPLSASRERPSAQTGQRYTVASGDSLWKIAARLRDNGSEASLQALMADIHALNPGAFARGDINRLHAGADLLLPDSAFSAAAQTLAGEPPAALGAPTDAPATALAESPSVDVVSEPGGSLQPASAAALATNTTLLQEQQRVDAELSKQINETLRLQQSLAELQLQMQQLQEEMSVRDRQISGLQAELAARAAAAKPMNGSDEVSPVAEAAVAGSNWLSLGWAGLGLLALALVGLFWRTRQRPAPSVQAAKRVHVPSQVAPPAPRAKAAAVSISANQGQAASGPAWPAAETTDALQSANVYIAYGRFSEAAANLRKALESQPERNDIRFRLLEVLAQLGDAQAFVEEEARLRTSSFSSVRIDELKALHAHLFAQSVPELLDDAVLQLDEEPQTTETEGADAKLNLDDLSLDADWDLVTPFARPKAERRVASEDVFTRAGSRDARSPFAETMLVEESSNSDWNVDDLDDSFAASLRGEDSALPGVLQRLAGSQDNLAKLNMALAYIEQGSLESACSILNEVIADGNEAQRQEARQLLAKIA